MRAIALPGTTKSLYLKEIPYWSRSRYACHSEQDALSDARLAVAAADLRLRSTRLFRDGGKARPSRLRRSLAFSVWEGVAAEVVGACSGGAVLTGWALYVGAGPIVLGLIVALPQAAQIIQVPAAWITSRAGSRRTALWSVAASRQSLLLLCLLPWLADRPRLQAGMLVGIAALSTLLSVLGNNGWVAWMGEMVPPPIRGRFFGWRTAITTVANATGSLLSGALLDTSRRSAHEGRGLALLALCAAAAGAGSTWLMRQQHACPEEHSNDGLVRDALAPWRDARARQLLDFQVAWNGAVGLAGGFFTLFMLRELRMSFVDVATYGAVTAVCRVGAAPFWGRAIDRAGAARVVTACSFAIAFIPLLWLWARPDVLWPIWLDAISTGLLWSGHSLGTFQLPLTLAPRRGRPYYLAAFAMSGGVAFALATELGGWILGHAGAYPITPGSPVGAYELLFSASSVARFGAAVLSLRIGEARIPAPRGLSGISEADAGT